MHIGELLIWYSSSVLWLLVAALGIVRLRRSLRGQAAFRSVAVALVNAARHHAGECPGR
jgi:hypothetical protein